MSSNARLQGMSHGSRFKAFTLRGGQYSRPIDPFLGIDHARISGPTFLPHPRAGFAKPQWVFHRSRSGSNPGRKKG